ncbi:hypothetical protein G6F57_023774 [Rhizopus arrhizus]|nr:hypothetical protein G6F59_017677 [Rhizopus arrhizus]KAG1387378.1 hypothetical protein G6F58_013662 [Rhizopus delemar]KAG1416711.1 hypothetical protein G6F57_023774 [Rhizopus arrhizus]
MPAQRFRAVGAAASVKVRRRRAQHLRQRREPPRDQRGIVQLRPQPDRHVEALAHGVDQAVFHGQVQPQFGILAQKARQQRR